MTARSTITSPRTPASLTCLQCQQRKRKCDKQHPRQGCRQRGTECTAVLRARLPRGRQARSLHSRSEPQFQRKTGDSISEETKYDAATARSHPENVVEPHDVVQADAAEEVSFSGYASQSTDLSFRLWESERFLWIYLRMMTVQRSMKYHLELG